MAHLLSDLVKYFAFDEINIDNWMFKMYYKVSMVICMAGATVGIASQYFGDPIRFVDHKKEFNQERRQVQKYKKFMIQQHS